MREYRIQCEDAAVPAGQQPSGSALSPTPVTCTLHNLQGACPLTCNGTVKDHQSSTVARSHSMKLATESRQVPEVWLIQSIRRPRLGSVAGVVHHLRGLRLALSDAGSG